MQAKAPMDPEVQQFIDDNPDIESYEVLLTDLNGILRGKWLSPESFARLFGGDFKTPLTTVTPDIWGRDVDSLCQETGDGDGLCEPISGSLRRLGWLPRPTAQMFLQLNDDKGPCEYDPRVVLQNVLNKYKARGLRAVTAPELEFYLLLESRDPQGRPSTPDSRMNGSCRLGGQVFSTELMHEYSELMHEIRISCRELQLPLDTLVKELSPGQFELNLNHCDDPLQAADNAQMLKRVIKGVAQKHGYIASFMAMPFTDMAGNGLHTHVSVLDADDNNIFDNGGDEGTESLRHAIGGLAASMADTYLIFAPHMNSFRRLNAGNHAPTAPSWGYENRDVAMRVPNGSSTARRIEYRVGGADANPYLVLAAVLAGILHGLDNRIEPEPPQTPDSEPLPSTLPGHWPDAIRTFETSSYVAEMLGANFQRAYAAIKHQEQSEFERDISTLEYNTYLVSS